MDLDMAMDMTNQEQLMHTISQLDSALAYLASPSTSPPHEPPVLVPPYPSCATTSAVTPSVVTMPVSVPPPAAAYPEITATRRLVGIHSAADVERPRRRNGRVSSEPQSVAARLRRERVSQRMRELQRLVPGGARLDTASMLEEAVRYVRFLKSHVQALEQAAAAMHGRRVDDIAGGDLYHHCRRYA